MISLDRFAYGLADPQEAPEVSTCDECGCELYEEAALCDSCEDELLYEDEDEEE